MKSIENTTTSGENLENVGKEYISKCVEITAIIEMLMSQFTNSIYLIKSTLGLVKPELEDIKKDMGLTELNIYIEIINENISEMSKTAKESKIKLQHIAKLNIDSEVDRNTKDSHLENYNKFHNIITELIDRLMVNILDKLYDLLKNLNQLLISNQESYTLLSWHTNFLKKLKEALAILKTIYKNNSNIITHIMEYRENLRKKTKIIQIINEINKVTPITLMRPESKIHINELKKGSIFSMNLYDMNSKLIKESYIPFSKKDIKELTSQNISSLIKHNNFDKNMNPSDYKIVVIDDDKAFTDIMDEKLGNLHFNVEIYNDPKEALEIIIKNLPDLILIDIKMPNINGISLLKNIYKLNNKKAKFKSIIVSALIDERLIKEAIRTGADDYITKPFSMNDLLIKITSHLELKS